MSADGDPDDPHGGSPGEIRQRAHEALAAGRFDVVDDLLRGGRLDVGELVQNLQIHQAELELQADELQRTNARLEVAGRRFRQLFTALPQSAFVTDRFGAVLDVNREAERLFALPTSRQLKPVLARLGADLASSAAVRQAFVGADRNGRSGAAGVRLRAADGSLRLVDISIERIDGEEPDDRFIVLVVDATERYGDQEQLRLLEAAVANLNDVVLITEAEPLDEPGPALVFVNDAFERLSGYQAAEVVGRSPRFLQGPDTDRGELARIREALERRIAVRSEIVNHDRDGRPYWIELEIVPLLDAERRCTHFVAVQRDVTERRRAEGRERQSQRLEALGHLTGGVAHDFNNLLSVILGYADELASADGVDIEHRRMARFVRLAAERGAELTQRLLAFGRQQVLRPVAVDVDDLVSGLVEQMLRRTIGEHISIEADLGAGGPVEADPAQLESVLLNLVVNARDAIAGSGTIRIGTRPRAVEAEEAAGLDVAPGRFVAITVTDDGGGIAAADIEHVFEPFFTTKPTGTGTGLGLPIAYGFARQSGGAIHVASTSEGGTTIELLLPAVDAPAAPSAEHVANPGPAPVDPGVVLLVEDDDMVRSLAAAQLRALGHQVVVAADAAEALERLEGLDHVGLLFTDVLLPGGTDGRQLADEVCRRRPGTRVLFTSGYTHDALATDGRLDPGVRLLQKPYRRDDLAAALAAVLTDASERDPGR